jgi:hypothetical protein
MLYFDRVGSLWGLYAKVGSSWGKNVITPREYKTRKRKLITKID